MTRVSHPTRKLVILGVTVVAACDSGPRDAPSEISVAEIDTLVTAESETLARPTEIATDDRGNVYVLDAGDASIYVLDPSGMKLRSIAREGAGPGELRWPRSLRIAGDTIRVLDVGNGRIQTFTTDGVPIGTITMPGDASSGAVAFAADGSALVALNGSDSALAQRYAPSGTAGSRLGAPIAPPSAVWDFVAIKQEIREGAVPAAIRNIVHPVLADDGSGWLLLQAEGRVQRYSPSDSMLWDVGFDLPEFAAIRQQFVDRNLADDAPNRFTPLRYFVHGRVVGSDLWILLHQPESEPSLILIIAEDGSLETRILFPTAQGVRGFALDAERGLVYLLVLQDATVLRARLADSVF
ncbi:MAG: 6-bladed beta-propeller [Gemmatimonadales bacterium]